MPQDVFCAATGALPDDADLPADHPSEDEELADLPVGWTRVTLQTRTPNPAWQEIVAVEEAMVGQVIQGLPKAQRKGAVVGVRVQVAAQLAALKAATAPYLIETEVAHFAPGDEGDKALAALKATLGLVDGGDEEVEEADEADAAEADESGEADAGNDE
jgi:hypothetical protein